MPFADGLINELQNVRVTVNITTSQILMKLERRRPLRPHFCRVISGLARPEKTTEKGHHAGRA